MTPTQVPESLQFFTPCVGQPETLLPGRSCTPYPGGSLLTNTLHPLPPHDLFLYLPTDTDFLHVCYSEHKSKQSQGCQPSSSWKGFWALLVEKSYQRRHGILILAANSARLSTNWRISKTLLSPCGERLAWKLADTVGKAFPPPGQMPCSPLWVWVDHWNWDTPFFSCIWISECQVLLYLGSRTPYTSELWILRLGP